jgi:hypothetical protein
MDRDRIWNDDRLQMDDRRLMTGYGSQEMNHGRQMAINLHPFCEDIEVMQSDTILEIKTLISNYQFSLGRRYAFIQCTGGMAPPCTIQGSIKMPK